MCRKTYLVGCAGVEPTTNGLKVRNIGQSWIIENLATAFKPLIHMGL